MPGHPRHDTAKRTHVLFCQFEDVLELILDALDQGRPWERVQAAQDLIHEWKGHVAEVQDECASIYLGTWS